MILILILVAIAVLIGLIAWWVDGRFKFGLAFFGIAGLLLLGGYFLLDFFV